MKLLIQSKGFSVTEGLRNFVETNMRFVLTRYAGSLDHAQVTLLDINGPRGGEDKRCRVKVKMHGMAPIVIQETDSDMYEAIRSCCNRLKRTVDRHTNRIRDQLQTSRSRF